MSSDSADPAPTDPVTTSAVTARWKDEKSTDRDAADRAPGDASPSGDDPAEPASSTPPADGPHTVTKRRRGRAQRFEARKVHRLVRHIDPWSTAKFAVVFFLAMWVMMMVAALIVWAVADRAGTIGNIESFFQDLGFKDVEIDDRFYVRGLGLVGLVMTFALSVGSIVGAMVFNLISDIIGGIWITVIEEESARPVSGSPDNSDVG